MVTGRGYLYSQKTSCHASAGKTTPLNTSLRALLIQLFILDHAVQVGKTGQSLLETRIIQCSDPQNVG